MDQPSLYENDIVIWAEQQASALRALGLRPELSNALDWNAEDECRREPAHRRRQAGRGLPERMPFTPEDLTSPAFDMDVALPRLASRLTPSGGHRRSTLEGQTS
jgi:hypothetical protein